MNGTTRKTHLLISGDFKEEELNELEGALNTKEVEVSKYLVKTFDTQEVIKVLLRNFDAYVLLRDGILFELLLRTISKTFTWIKSKKSGATISVGLELHFQTNGKTIPINISVSVPKEDFWPELQQTLTLNYIDNLEGDEIINIFWNTQEGKINIKRMKI